MFVALDLGVKNMLNKYSLAPDGISGDEGFDYTKARQEKADYYTAYLNSVDALANYKLTSDFKD